ncbi:MAG TPA: hypothetical protein VMX97_17575 [Hyphomicrobiaceae bacterium]|nr:hypothetical protein [Hyphomicrobiaceae bacterium]
MAFWSGFTRGLLLVGFLLAGVSWIAIAGLAKRPFERFRTSTYEFELIDGWKCRLDGTEYICVYGNEDERRQAILVMASKVRGAIDTFEAYIKHLKTPRVLTNEDGKSIQSKILRVGRRRVGRYEWVEGLHIGSEISTYRTHYFATVTSHLAVLITFSVHRDYVTKFEPQFAHMIETLRIFQREY